MSVVRCFRQSQPADSSLSVTCILHIYTTCQLKIYLWNLVQKFRKISFFFLFRIKIKVITNISKSRKEIFQYFFRYYFRSESKLLLIHIIRIFYSGQTINLLDLACFYEIRLIFYYIFSVVYFQQNYCLFRKYLYLHTCIHTYYDEPLGSV